MTEPATNLLPESFGHAIAGALGYMYRHLPAPAQATVRRHRAALFMLTLVPPRDGGKARAWSHGLVLPVDLPADGPVDHAQRIVAELRGTANYIGLLRTGDKLPDDVPILGFGFVYHTTDPAASKPLRIVFVDLDGEPFTVTEAAVEVHPQTALLDTSTLDTETLQMCLFALTIVSRAVTHKGNIDALGRCLSP